MRFHPGHNRMVVSSTTVPGRDRVRTFALPGEVLEDPSLSVAEKRAILAEWASDLSAVESYPALRLLPGTTFPVTTLPAGLRFISGFIPITHSLEGMRSALLRGAPFSVLAHEIVVLTLFSLVLLPLSLAIFSYTLRRSRLEGTLSFY